VFTCVVYNASNEPLAIVESERGLILHLEGKAIILEEVPNRKFRSVNREFPIPTSIVLKEYRKTGTKYYASAQLNQRNLFTRDDFTCQYCGRRDPELRASEYLTRDHVTPLSRGGTDTWPNVVTCCSTCNHKKDDKTPKEADITLLSKPRAPTVQEILAKRTIRRKKFQAPSE
jgi:5-methylcytosine-specific restriction endonuclease McrA